MSSPIIDRRVAVGKEYLESSLQSCRPSARIGVDFRIVRDSKAIVILKYNGMTDVAYGVLYGDASLEALKQSALKKMEALIRNPANASAYEAKLWIGSEFFYDPHLSDPRFRSHSWAMICKEFSFDRDNQMRETPSVDDMPFYPESNATARLRRKISSPEIVNDLIRFLYT